MFGPIIIVYRELRGIYEINKKILDNAQKRENQAAIAAERPSRTILEILYGLGDVDYVNIVVQSDEIT